MEARFIPQRYEPNYAYPLLALFHARGGDEQQMVRSMPALSWRNYVGLSLRGPEAAITPGPARGFRLGSDVRPARPARHRDPRRRSPKPRSSGGGSWNRYPTRSTSLEDGVFSAIRQTRRTLHVHSERIFLVGIGEGAAVAYRLGLSYPERFAGVVAINGWIPGGFRPLGRLKACRDLRILVVHGEWNARVPVRIGPPRRRHAPRRRSSGRLPVLPLCPPPDLTHARRRRYLAHQPLHLRALRHSPAASTNRHFSHHCAERDRLPGNRGSSSTNNAIRHRAIIS